MQKWKREPFVKRVKRLKWNSASTVGAVADGAQFWRIDAKLAEIVRNSIKLRAINLPMLLCCCIGC